MASSAMTLIEIGILRDAWRDLGRDESETDYAQGFRDALAYAAKRLTATMGDES